VNRNIELVARREKKALAKLRCIGSDVDCVSCRTPTNSGGFGGGEVGTRKDHDPRTCNPDYPRDYIVDDAIPRIRHEEDGSTPKDCDKHVPHIRIVVEAYRVLHNMVGKVPPNNADCW